MMNHADRQDGDEPTVVSEATEIIEAYEGLTCEVCGEPIEPGSDYVKAAYGPVHSEPCSHQGKVT